ncbi:MAG: hypothetical protein ACYC35_16765 [Pirellulales bacterium]
MIDRGQKTFLEVGQALAKIRDGRLYRQKFTTFEQYCQERWGYKRTYVHYLTEAAKTVETISVHNCEQEQPILPTTESQARELGRLPEVQRAEAWQQAVERHGQPTAAQVREVVEGFFFEPEDEGQPAEEADEEPDENEEEAGEDLDDPEPVTAATAGLFSMNDREHRQWSGFKAHAGNDLDWLVDMVDRMQLAMVRHHL